MEIGNKAPEFCLPDADQQSRCLKDFLGKWVVLYFYPKDNTPGCTTEALEFTALKEQFEKASAVILGISADSPKSHCNFRDRHHLSIMLLSDETKEVIQKYGVWQLKKQYGKEYYGLVCSTFLINPEENIAYIWKNVKAKGHAEAVLKKLAELQ